MTTTTRSKTIGVVGVTFVEHYPDNLLRLRDLSEETEANTAERLSVLLLRNPANAYDPNAVEIHVPALGEMAMIGHCAREVAALIAPRMDAGERFQADVAWVRINPEHMDRPGISIDVRRVIEKAVA